MIHYSTLICVFQLVSHAECKAIIGVPSVRNCTLYVTKYPCYQCARAIVQAGITKVVYDKEGGWKDERYISSRETLRTCLGKENIRNIRLVLKQHVYAITVSLIEVMSQVH